MAGNESPSDCTTPKKERELNGPHEISSDVYSSAVLGCEEHM